MFDDGDRVDLQALAAAAPGPSLASRLAGIDLAAVNGHARVVVMQAWQRQSSWTAAQLYESMAYVARSPMCGPDCPPRLTQNFGEFAAAEVGAALTLSPGSADRELAVAYQLTERLPATQAALAAGRIDLATAIMIADETAHLSDQLARQAEESILEIAAGSGLTRQQLSRRLRRKVLQLDPCGAEQRRRQAQRGRRVRFGAGPDGTGFIAGYDLPLDQLAGARAFIKDLAKSLRSSGDDRTLTQLEADVMLDLLQGHHLNTNGIQPKIELVAPAETWLHLGNEPAELAGLGTISADTLADILAAATSATDPVAANPAAGNPTTHNPAAARDSDDTDETRGDARGDAARADDTGRDSAANVGSGSGGGRGLECTWSVTRNGIVIRHGSGRYQPTRAQRRFIEAMYRTCTHPGCTRPATHCDLDHLTEYRHGGPTCPCNLIPLCRHHHRAKHQAGWWWTRTPTGNLQAQSPLGHTYTHTPDPLPGTDPATHNQPPPPQPEPKPAPPAPQPTRPRTLADTIRALNTGPDQRGPTQQQAGTPF